MSQTRCVHKEVDYLALAHPRWPRLFSRGNVRYRTISSTVRPLQLAMQEADWNDEEEAGWN